MPEGETQGKKPTAEEHLARIDECVKLLRMRSVDGRPITIGSIKKLFASKYGSRPRTVMRYVKKAQDRIVAESGLSKATHKALTTEFLNSIIGDVTQRTADRLAANKQYMDLFGLPPSQRNQIPSDGGQHLHLHSTAPMTLEERKRALLEHIGIRDVNPSGDDGRGTGAPRATDVIEVPRRHPGGGGSTGGSGIADGEGVEIGTESDAGE